MYGSGDDTIADLADVFTVSRATLYRALHHRVRALQRGVQHRDPVSAARATTSMSCHLPEMLAGHGKVPKNRSQ